MKNFKKAIALLLSLLMLLPLSSCGGDEKETTVFGQSDGVYKPIMFDIKPNCKGACFSDGIIFAAYDDGMTAYSVSDGSSSELASGKYSAVSAYEDKIYTVNEESGEIEIYLSDGTLFEKISLDGTDIKEKLAYINDYGDAAFVESIASNGKKIYFIVNCTTAGDFMYEYDIDAKDEKEFDFSIFEKNSRATYTPKSISFCDDNTLLFTYLESLSLTSRSYAYSRYDIKKGKTIDTAGVNDLSAAFYDKSDESLYYCERAQIKKAFFKASKNDEPDEIFELSGADCPMLKDGYVQPMLMLYITGGKIIYCYSDCAGVIVPTEYTTITVYKKEGLPLDEKIIDKMKSEYKTFVKVKEIPGDLYTEKLNLKLLGGDEDFDVFYVYDYYFNIKDYLDKSMFLPLDPYPAAEKFDLMYNGAREFMTYSGKIFGIPYSAHDMSVLKISDGFEKTGFELPSLYVDFDTLFDYCDKLIERGGNDVTLFYESAILNCLMYYCIQDYIDSGDKDGLKDVLSKIKKYSDAGVLYGKDDQENRIYLFGTITNSFDAAPGKENIDKVPERYKNMDGDLRLLLSPCGKHYLQLNGYCSVNPKSKNKEEAMALLSLLADKGIFDDFSGATWGKDYAKNHPDLYEKTNENMRKYIELTEKSFEKAAPFTVYYMDMYKCYGTGLSKLLDGKISAEEALNEICGEIDYLYFE